MFKTISTYVQNQNKIGLSVYIRPSEVVYLEIYKVDE